jgi:hypothetical protein
VHDYYRTTWVYIVKGGTAVTGGTSFSTNCGRYNSEWSVSAKAVQTSVTWDRSDKYNYKNYKHSTTLIGLEFVVNGTKYLDQSSTQLAKTSSFTTVAKTNLGPFLVELCPTAQRMAAGMEDAHSRQSTPHR